MKLRNLAVCVVLVYWAGPSLFGQGPGTTTGLPHDWSHHHMVFSPPATIEKYLKASQDPRYWHQQYWRYGAANAPWWPGNSSSAPGHNKGGGGTLKSDWSMSMGSAATVGAGMFPAKYSFNPIGTPNCTNDFVVFNTGLPGSSTQATIIAYNELYAGAFPGCGTSGVPAVYWQYNTAYNSSRTADGSKITSSVVLSADGKQVAFVQNNSSSQASLVLLKWASSTSLVAMNTTSNNVANSAYHGCTAPCMTVLPLSGSHNDTHSAPFYDYLHDVIYVGDDPSSDSGCASGTTADCAHLHQFTGVFKSTPAEVTTSPWPVVVASAPLSSPVYDSTSGNIFITSSYDGSNNGGRLHQVNASTGAQTASKELGPTGVSGSACNGGSSGDTTALVVDAPIVDSSAGKVYVFLGNNGAGQAAVYQFSPNFAAGSCPSTNVTVGTGSTSGVPLYSGDFDNIYFSSSQTTPTGHLYVCGNTGATPTLYEVAISGNVLGTVTTGPALATGSTTCSPVSEFYNVSTDRIFLSVQADKQTASPISCPTGTATGCIMSFTVSSALISSSTATSATALETGGTSGIVIDNAATSPTGASQVYFSTLGNQACAGNGTTGSGTGGCAIQASQSGLN